MKLRVAFPFTHEEVKNAHASGTPPVPRVAPNIELEVFVLASGTPPVPHIKLEVSDPFHSWADFKSMHAKRLAGQCAHLSKSLEMSHLSEYSFRANRLSECNHLFIVHVSGTSICHDRTFQANSL